MAAATAVFQTYELLEWTLLHLPLQDLLLAEQVCKTWQQVVQKSDRISKALFRRPARCDVDLFMPGAAYSRENRQLFEKIQAPVCYLNPFLSEYADCLRQVLQLRQTLFEPDKMSNSIPHGGEASWKKMLLLQPPPISTAFICKGRMHGRQTLDVSRVMIMDRSSEHRDENTSLGDICSFLDEHHQKCPHCPTLAEVACEKEEHKVPGWSMCVLQDPVFLDAKTLTGLECLAKLEDCRGPRGDGRVEE